MERYFTLTAMFSRNVNNFDKHLDTFVSFGSSCSPLNAASVLRQGSSSPVHLDSYFMSVVTLVFLILRLRIGGSIPPCLP